ncbi:MAG TPA: grasp-with-spasm system ATP-grasp peptide maturase [Bacteroidia bacterium]|jgi:ATP-GRASP peptide maturase of grasp-with-spasm system|nr:grasp-with-spasm system ATP-grasp peptide maturase [Bacteroidia bacterium]
MIIIFGSNYDSSTKEVIQWLNKGSEEVVLISGIKDYKALSIHSFSKSGIKAVWYRKYETQQTKRIKINPEIVSFLNDEYRSYRNYVYRLFQTVRTLGNSFEAMDPDKLCVLEEAKNCGLSTPNFIVTTNKQEVIDFFAIYSSVITKPIFNGISIKFDKNWQGIMYTSLVTKETINELPNSFFPGLFQQYIKKEIELRIFYLDGSFYSTAIFTQANGETIDCRKDQTSQKRRMVPYKLPNEIEKKLIQLMNRLELNTGSIDMIKTRNAEYVFLEVNPVGIFDETSINCNYYLNKKIAKWLSSQYEN